MDDKKVLAAETEDLYTLYIHTCLHNKKIYVGITSKDAEQLWNDGNVYKSNSEFYSDIVKFGWENGFLHQIVAENLTSEQAKEEKKHFIDIYCSTDPKKVYNHKQGNAGCSTRQKKVDIGGKIKALRENKNITQQQLADAIKIKRGTLGGYETNKRTPDINVLNMLADFFKVGLDYFGVESQNASFEINSRVIEYFRSKNQTLEDKRKLFDDIVSAYYLYVIDKE